MTTTTTRIDVWYDVVCPWCWLGKARLDSAVKEVGGEVEVVSRSFQLDGKADADLDILTTDMLVKKYGMSRAQIDALHQRLVTMGHEVGIEYKFDRVRTSNTFDAHQLVHHARKEGGESKANELAERLFKANFQDGKRIGTRDVLLAIAAEAGLNEAEVRAALETAAYAENVRADESKARGLGVSGVPFFLINGKVGISGAQTVDVLKKAIAT